MDNCDFVIIRNEPAIRATGPNDEPDLFIVVAPNGSIVYGSSKRVDCEEFMDEQMA